MTKRAMVNGTKIGMGGGTDHHNQHSSPPPPYLFDPGPDASGLLKRFIEAFLPILCSSSPFLSSSLSSDIEYDASSWAMALLVEDVESFALAELIRAHGEEEGTRLARIYQPAVERTVAKCGGSSGSGAGESSPSKLLPKKIVAAKLCAYAGMFDFFRKFDGGISDSFGADGDAAIQLSEWIYGYRLIIKGAFFKGLKIKTEDQARAAFREMCGGIDDEVDYNQWCDYVERKEIGFETGLATLFDGRAEEEEKEAAAAADAVAKLAREALLAQEARLAEETLLSEESTLSKKDRLAEEAMQSEEGRLADEVRLSKEAQLVEEARLEVEARLAEEERKAVEEAAKLDEEARLAEEDRLAEEAKLEEESRLNGDVILTEEARKAEDARLTKLSKLVNEACLAKAAKTAKAETSPKKVRHAKEVLKVTLDPTCLDSFVCCCLSLPGRI